MRTNTLKARVFAVMVMAAVLVALMAPAAGARYRPPKGNSPGWNGVFFPIRVCPDGVEFALGAEYDPALDDDPNTPPATQTEAVTLYRGNYQSVLVHLREPLPKVFNPVALVPGWDVVKPNTWLSVFQRPWSGVAVGDQLTGLMYSLTFPQPPLPVDVDEEGLEEFPKASRGEKPLVVESCSVFGPGRGFWITTQPFLADATLGQPYSTRLAATDGTAPFRWKRLSKLPKGLKLNAKTGVIFGTPRRQAGTFSFGVQARDNAKPRPRLVTTKTFTITVK